VSPFARVALSLSLGLVVLWIGCDRSREDAAEAEAIHHKPPVQTGNVGQAMRAEPVRPRLPTTDDRLLLAIREGDRARAERLIAEGATLDPEAALLVAAVRGKGDLAFVRWLAGQGVGVDVPDAAGRTPLSWAAGSGSEDEVVYLSKRGASVDTVDQLGRTPLHYGVFSGDPVVVISLLEANADIDAQDALGTTPLMYACAKNQRALVETLQSRGADPTLKDKLGRTAAERAHGENNPCGAGPSLR
jgi:hypothetical protein